MDGIFTPVRHANGYGIVALRKDRIKAITEFLQDLGNAEPLRALLLLAGPDELDHRHENAAAAASDVVSAVELIRAILSIDVPIVCAIAGRASGPGASIALACDVVIAAETASLEPTLRGAHQTPSAGISWLLPRLVGPAQALGSLLLADKITAREAERKGMIWRCVPDDRLLDEGHALATYFATQSPEAMYAVKQAVRAAVHNKFDEQLELEASLARGLPQL